MISVQPRVLPVEKQPSTLFAQSSCPGRQRVCCASDCVLGVDGRQFFLILGVRVLKRLRPGRPLPLATSLTVTPGCCSTLSRVVFLIAAGEMRSWSARYCSSLPETEERGGLELEETCTNQGLGAHFQLTSKHVSSISWDLLFIFILRGGSLKHSTNLFQHQTPPSTFRTHCGPPV